MNATERSVQNLEARLSRMRRDFVALMVFGGAFLLASAVAQQDRPKELTLEKLSIVDSEGRPSLELRTDADGNGEVVLVDAEGEPLLYLGTSADGHGALDVMNRDHERMVSIGVSTDGDGGVRVDARSGSPVFYMGQDLRGNGQVPDKVNPGRRLD